MHFRRGTKQRYGFGVIDQAVLAQGLADLHGYATQPDAQLVGRDYLLDRDLSDADFRVVSYLVCNDIAGLALSNYPKIDPWYRRIAALAAWRDPFAGLDAPRFPPIIGKS